MGKKGYNWKAREVVKTIIDNTKTKKIKVDFDDKNKFDDANELVLPSKKRKTKVKREQQSVTRILSKKQRKHLEKIVEKKKKKENRANLLEALSKVQASKEELSQLTSISSIQTQGLKRYFQGQKEEERPKKRRENVDSDEKINSVTGSRFKRINLINNSINIDENDPNIVGFDESDNESDDSETNDAQSGGITIDDQVKRETGTSDCQTVDESEINDDQGQTNSETKSETETNDCQTIIKGENLEETNDDQGQTKSETETNDCQTVIKTNEVKNKTKKSLKLEKNKPAIFETGTNDCQTAIESETNDDQGQTKSETKTNDCQKAKNKTISVKLEKNKPAIFVSVNRKKEIQKSRLKLPILAEEQQIMETINENSFILIAGETGSGKTTQVPQFLYEAGYAQDKIIAITEPRRVAAIAMSKRIAQEMNLSEKEISYLIRFEGNVTENTKIKFMTDGVLLKELQNDFLLSKYSVVILDEAHERSVYTDILIGLLSRIVPLRNKKNNPLKLIIMSATLRLSDFTDNSRLFKQPPPVIKVEARQFPVTIHFNKRTPDDYIKEAFNKTCKIHTKLPEGGVLIFVTGQQEVNRLVKKLRSAFPLKNTQKLKNKLKIEESNDSDSENNLKQVLKNKRQKNYLPEINLDDFGMPGENISDQESNSDSSDDEITQKFNNCQPLYTLPLYSLLSTQKQSKVFDPAPENCRLCVVSTNIAETSLTIPGIKYVVDTGKSKNKLYDKLTGVSSYQIMWTSRASADQRAGRAGRLGPGHCYRLYSSAVFNDVFQKFSIPEIQQKPVDDLYLQMKCMNIDKIINFPFPTAPDLMQLKMAEHRLEILGALKNKNVTPLGKAISQFPVLPRFGKMLALSHQQDLLPYTILIVSALSVQEVLLETPLTINNIDEAKKLRQKWLILRKQWAGAGNLLLLGDPLVLMKAIGAAEFANTKNELEKFCFENGLRQKAVIEIRKLRIQLTNEIKLNIPDSDIIVDPKLKPPSDLQAKLLRQILLSGLGDQIAKKIDLNELSNEDKTKYKYAYNAMNLQDPVYIHSNSVLKRTLPEYIIYQEIYETNKLYLRGVTAIEPAWLPTYVPHLCNISDPLLDPEPRFDPTSGKILCTVNATFGSQAWILPQTEIEFPKSADLYKWFARFLLEGKIFPKLEKYTDNLLTKPSTMVKTWAKLQPKTEILLKALISKDICRKDILKNIWEVQPKFLLHEYQKWLPETAHNEISLMWPPI